MVSRVVISTEAVFEDGRPRTTEPLPLHPGDRVTIQVELPGTAATWPPDTAEIYRQIEGEGDSWVLGEPPVSTGG